MKLGPYFLAYYRMKGHGEREVIYRGTDWQIACHLLAEEIEATGQTDAGDAEVAANAAIDVLAYAAGPPRAVSVTLGEIEHVIEIEEAVR
jgi:hypothetical protein